MAVRALFVCGFLASICEAQAVGEVGTDEASLGGQECSDLGTEEASLLQHTGRIAASKQQIEAEQGREEALANFLVQNTLLSLSALLPDGTSHADGIALIRELASSFKIEDLEGVDLSSNASFDELNQAQMASGHELVCALRGRVNCDMEWTEVFTDVVQAVPRIASSLLLTAVGKGPAKGKEQKKPFVAPGKGKVNSKILKLGQESLKRFMEVAVKGGENPDAEKMVVAKAMSKLAQMDDQALLAYDGRSKAELAMLFAQSSMRLTCLQTTDSCSEAILRVLGESSGLVGSAVRAVARPTVQVAMAALGIPERPEETKAEREAAIRASTASGSL